tara:strand:+ start:110 stop:364 length:255 start_codon:yes stop_codon:yes gene_type:complete
MARYIKRPIEVEAIQFDGDNYKECEAFIGKKNIDNKLSYPNIITSEGTMKVNINDFIIKEPFDKERDCYPCKPDVFKKTYSVVL